MKKVTINYKTKKDWCHECDRKIANPKVSENRIFEINMDDVLEWKEDWNHYLECDDSMIDIVDEFLFDIIGFYGVRGSESLIVEEEEVERVANFIKENYKEEFK